MTRYRAIVEYELSDRIPPDEALWYVKVRLREAEVSRVVQIERLDPAWCEECQTMHPGAWWSESTTRGATE